MNWWRKNSFNDCTNTQERLTMPPSLSAGNMASMGGPYDSEVVSEKAY